VIAICGQADRPVGSSTPRLEALLILAIANRLIAPRERSALLNWPEQNRPFWNWKDRIRHTPSRVGLWSSLGYEQCDGRLCRRAWSPVVALTSADGRRGSMPVSTSPPSQRIPPRLVHKSVHKQVRHLRVCGSYRGVDPCPSYALRVSLPCSAR